MTTDSQGSFNLRRFLLSGEGWPYLLVPFIVVAIVLEFAHASASLIFVTSALGVIPTAATALPCTCMCAAASGLCSHEIGTGPRSGTLAKSVVTVRTTFGGGDPTMRPSLKMTNTRRVTSIWARRCATSSVSDASRPWPRSAPMALVQVRACWRRSSELTLFSERNSHT